MSVWPVSRIKIPPYKIFISYFLISFISVGLCNEADQDAPAISSYNIHLSRNQLEQAGIESQKLLEKKLNPELVAFALVLNIQKLLELKNQLAIATTRYEEAKTNFGQAQQTLKRLLNLHQNKAISKRKLQIQQTAWRAKKTILESTKLQKQAIIQNVKLNWGNILLNWISDSNDNNLTRIISGKQSLLSLNLPVNKTLALNKNLIFIHPAGDRTKAKQAEFISPAPQSYLSSQGEIHFFVTQNGFRAGLHLTAWLPQQKAISGVIIPRNAIIWHLGQTFVYQQLEPDIFKRHLVSQSIETPQGLFLSDQHLIGKTIVKVGAQTLLSEELKSQIPDEDDD